MSITRLLIPFILSIAISYNGVWLSKIYSTINSADFKSLGKLPSFEIPCSQAPAQARQKCEKLYRITKQQLGTTTSHTSQVMGLGLGVMVGGTEWFCDIDSNLVPVHKTGNGDGQSAFREGLTLYQTGSIPLSVCTNDILIVSTRDKLNSTGNVGWKSGELVRGNPSIVASFKIANDLFSSYIRAFISIAALFFLLIYLGMSGKKTWGSYWYKSAILLFSIHFFSSSSLLDFLLPTSFGLGFPLLMAGGTGGCVFLLFALNEVKTRRESFSRKRHIDRFTQPIIPIASVFLLALIYRTLGGSWYAWVQWSLALIMLPLALTCSASALSVFAALFNSDVLANKGILPGLPTNSATHFLLLNFLYDSLEWLWISSRFVSRLDDHPSLSNVKELLASFGARFGIRRMSSSMFTRDFHFRTCDLQDPNNRVVAESDRVSQLAASVMTARAPLLRVTVGSQQSRILKGPDTPEDRSKGSEYCVFPLVHGQKVVGALNITGYPRSSLGDPSQMILFLSLLDRLIPRFAEFSYRESLSPNIDEENTVLAIESGFSARPEKNQHELMEHLNRLAESVDCKIIISRAVYRESRYSTYSSHNYSAEDAHFLETHSPRLGETLVTSPSNVALTRRMVVYLNDVPRMFSIYPDKIVQLFKRNETKSLIVKPVMLKPASDPWGVIWIEFPNKLNRPESDLNDLATFVSDSVNRQLVAHLEYMQELRLQSELSQFLPGRVADKIKAGLSVREEEQGYLLNIDLSGSTALARQLGDQGFKDFVSALAADLQDALKPFAFEKQMVIWDAFIFTRPHKLGPLSELEVKAIHARLEDKFQGGRVGYRGVLHHGDITRDFISTTGNRSWGISGSALAESCKLEARLKGRKSVLLVSKACAATLREPLDQAGPEGFILEAHIKERKSIA